MTEVAGCAQNNDVNTDLRGTECVLYFYCACRWQDDPVSGHARLVPLNGTNNTASKCDKEEDFVDAEKSDSNRLWAGFGTACLWHVYLVFQIIQCACAAACAPEPSQSRKPC